MELSKRKIIIESWKKLKEHIGLWIFIMLFIFALSLVISLIQERILDDITAQTILFIIAAGLFQAGINLGTLKIALNIHNNIETEFNQIFSNFHLLLTFILATIACIILIVIAAAPGIILVTVSISANFDKWGNLSYVLLLLFIIVPAVYASIRLQLYDYFLVDEECGAIDAIKKSIAATRGYAGELFILGAILSTIILISMIPLMLGLCISVPLATMVNAHIYLKLKNHAINE